MRRSFHAAQYYPGNPVLRLVGGAMKYRRHKSLGVKAADVAGDLPRGQDLALFSEDIWGADLPTLQALPNPGNGPVSYQTDPSPATDDRVSRQGYSGAAPANAGNGTILLKTDGLSSFTMESFDDAGARISAASHAYSLDSAGAGVTTNFPPTVIPSIPSTLTIASIFSTASRDSMMGINTMLSLAIFMYSSPSNP